VQFVFGRSLRVFRTIRLKISEQLNKLPNRDMPYAICPKFISVDRSRSVRGEEVGPWFNVDCISYRVSLVFASCHVMYSHLTDLASRLGFQSRSYQLDVSPDHAVFYVSPSQNPHISTIECHASRPLLALHIDVPCVSQDTTEHSIVLVRSVDHTDPTRGIVQLSETCREG
jgi:hypothetical protein